LCNSYSERESYTTEISLTMNLQSFTIPFEEPTLRGTPLTKGITECIISAGDKVSLVVSPWPNKASFGLTREDIDEGGWKSKGVFFQGRNLTDGGRALKVDWFEDSYGSPTSIRMNVDRTTDGYLDVYYDFEIDGKWQPLGQAFHVKDTYLSQGSPSSNWYPMIRYDDGVYKENKQILGSDLTLSCEKGEDIVLTPKRVINADIPFYVGKWSFDKLFFGPELGEIPLPKEQEWIVHLDKDGRIAFKLGNILSTTITGLNNDSCSKNICTDLSVGHLAMTKMLSPEPERSFEQIISEGMEKGISQIFYENDKLLIQGEILSIELKRKADNLVITE